MRTAVTTSRAALAALLALAACGDDSAAPGTLRVTVYGEEYIEEGIPADVFSDGWSVAFDSFVVVVGDVVAESGHGDAPAVEDHGYHVFDLAAPSAGAGYQVLRADVEGAVYDHFGYVVGPSA